MRVGSGMEANLEDRTVHFFSISSTCTASESTTSTPYLEQTIVELGSLEREEEEEREWPFKVELELAKTVGEDHKVVWGTVDGGAMLCVIDSTVWAQIEHWFGSLRESHIVCRMANGVCVPSLGTGSGVVGYRGHVWPIRFEVIDSRGAFELLLGKDWLHKAGAMQVFKTDSLALPLQTGTLVVKNENPKKPRPERKPVGPRSRNPSCEKVEDADEPTVELTGEPSTSVEQETAREPEQAGEPGEPVPRRSARLRKMARSGGAANPTWAEPGALEMVEGLLLDEEQEGKTLDLPSDLWQRAREESEEEVMRGVLLIEPVPQATSHGLTEVLRRADRNRARAGGPVDIAKITVESKPKPIPNKPPVPESPRTSDPFGEQRVTDILRKVQIGDELSDAQRTRVEGLLREYADVFALNLSEVLPVDFTEMKLDIPADATFPKRTGQRKLSEPQRQALYAMLDKLEDAHVIEKVTQDQVAAVSPINMVPKHGGADRTSLDTLRRMANSECRKYGLPVKYPEAGFYESTEAKPEGAPAKWRLVQNFAAVNKVTQIRPFPMGDLAAKQHAVAGHRFVSVMDLQAGFHAIPIAPESVPYTGFYVEGRGHYVYQRMPFGLTGAPTTFCEMVSDAFHELLGKILEVWMDDMATAADDFDTGMTNLRSIFNRCRERKISLSAAKMVLFMREATFAGARVSADGIRPDLGKVRAILEWPEPISALDIMGFLGAVGAHRTKIRNFARIAQPLSDLTRNVRTPPAATGNGFEYKKALREATFELDEMQKAAFVELKVALTTDPVLRAPIYDGRPFIVSTDGSKYGFGAVLSQRWEESDSKGNIRQVMYPVAFASKRTSRTEERYIPFLLEFAALKFAMDELDPIIFGREIEIETDCKALAELLGNGKTNSTHERWRESIIARNISAVRHLPGTENRLCDGLSRMYEGRPDNDEGPG
ncbi:Retrovirus-related Pol polyprotein from transposon opus [Ceratobasidium sp. AG-Ba]|nr:Retrovirus-related Pol polyprotein from transposon opus [Ceratobasidium sp. AG-Ba]